jgi:hypothetical protein
MVDWNFARIWDFCGDAAGVVMICRDAGRAGISIPPSPGTAAVWKVRKRIPADWLPVLVSHCLTAGLPADELFASPAAPSLDDLGL